MPKTRFIAQDVNSGDFLNWYLPLSKVSVTDTLSGANEIVGEFNPGAGQLNLSAYEPWATKVHLEHGGRIRGSGILQPYSLTEARARVLILGPSDYPHGIPFLGSFQGVKVDPLDMVRKLWEEVQSYPDGNLGVTLDDTTSPVRLGDVKELVDLDDISGPYKLVWWQAPDCGEEIDSLSRNTPFDYREVASWNADKTDVDYHIRLGYPRLGRFRSDLRFASGENVSNAIPWTEVDDQYASTVVVLGAGEGRRRIRATASERGARLRRVVVLSDKGIDSQERASQIARNELRRRKALISFEQITVDVSHPNAKWGSFEPGDDIPVTGNFPWLGRKTINHRITATTWKPESPLADLKLVPSAAQYYGPPLNGV